MKTYDDECSEFMKDYNNKHRLCPHCGFDLCHSTLATFVYTPDLKDTYKDVNRCVCFKCGFVHVKHDRISE